MKIEEYIKRHQNELNIHKADRDPLWNAINHSLVEKKARRMQFIRWAAASLLVFLVVGALVRHELVIQAQISSLSQINSELAEKEQLYKSQVQEKWSQFTSLEGGESPMETMLMDELKNLDTLYNNGLQEIKNTGYNERAIIILLETYEKRLRIIEQLIYEKQKHKNYENRNMQVEI